jgi:hypothetical protein
MKQITLDKTAELMLQMYYKTESEEPEVPHPDEVLHHEYAEAAELHYEWQRRMSGHRLILMHRLLQLVVDQTKPISKRPH